MMQFFKRLLLRRRMNRTIKSECATLRRWAERATVGK